MELHLDWYKSWYSEKQEEHARNPQVSLGTAPKAVDITHSKWHTQQSHTDEKATATWNRLNQNLILLQVLAAPSECMPRLPSQVCLPQSYWHQWTSLHNWQCNFLSCGQGVSWACPCTAPSICLWIHAPVSGIAVSVSQQLTSFEDMGLPPSLSEKDLQWNQ